jgi:hypothetical protein
MQDDTERTQPSQPDQLAHFVTSGPVTLRPAIGCQPYPAVQHVIPWCACLRDMAKRRTCQDGGPCQWCCDACAATCGERVSP